MKTEEKILSNKKNGLSMLLLISLCYLVSIGFMIAGGLHMDAKIFSPIWLIPFIIGIVYAATGWILFLGLKVVGPNEALVLTLFGKYVGTLKENGFYFVNPFCVSVNPAAGTKLSQSGDVEGQKSSSGFSFNFSGSETSSKISLKAMTLNNSRQKINVDTTGDGCADDGSLRGSTDLVAKRIRDEIEEKVAIAGIKIIDARFTYLAYAPEIAAAMLQRQQAAAVVDAKKLIVDGAVGMVEMALEQLSERNVVDLDEERKAAMVSNLLVVLCGNHDSQPIVNAGSLY